MQSLEQRDAILSLVFKLAPSPLIIKLKIWEKIKRTLTRDRINLLMELNQYQT
jgi:hypothetical protein